MKEQQPSQNNINSVITSTPLCVHDFNHLDSNYFYDRRANCFYWYRIDRFYCRKCVNIKEIKKEEMTYTCSSRPNWYIQK